MSQDPPHAAPDGTHSPFREEVEFNHLGRILGGVGAKVPITGGRLGSAARSRFEAHIALHYDRPGCFAYVGWVDQACTADVQWRVYGAFARAAVATGVHLGGLEPAEGFGLACWCEPITKPMHDAYDATYAKMSLTVAYALGLIGTDAGCADTRIALGCGRLRGSFLFGPQAGRVLLDGPRAVETIYGDIPNRCGGMAKGKDPVANKIFAQPGKLGRVSIFRQAWTYFHLQAGAPTTPVWSGAPVPADLIEQATIAPQPIPRGANQPHLVGLSLDFAKSSVEYGLDAHRARSVVNRVLGDLEEIAHHYSGLYVSPRYGDGVAAVIAVEAPDEAAVLRGEWVKPFREFFDAANQQLSQCHSLGLRIGLAIDLDTIACTPRLAGLSRVSSPAVEPLAQAVIDRARACHRPGKAYDVQRRVGIFLPITAAPGVMSATFDTSGQGLVAISL